MTSPILWYSLLAVKGKGNSARQVAAVREVAGWLGLLLATVAAAVFALLVAVVPAAAGELGAGRTGDGDISRAQWLGMSAGLWVLLAILGARFASPTILSVAGVLWRTTGKFHAKAVNFSAEAKGASQKIKRQFSGELKNKTLGEALSSWFVEIPFTLAAAFLAYNIVKLLVLPVAGMSAPQNSEFWVFAIIVTVCVYPWAFLASKIKNALVQMEKKAIAKETVANGGTGHCFIIAALIGLPLFVNFVGLAISCFVAFCFSS